MSGKGQVMTEQHPFKWRHYEAEIILLCVRWYLRYSLSDRDLEEIMLERGLHADHTCNGYLAHPFSKLTTSPTQPIYVLGTELD
jgi:transposase-like protein